jgi:three-Cys-motif partner protein
MTSYNQDDKVGPWARDKLKCLRDYLSAYTTILKNQPWCPGYFYIDAFAGAGINEIRKPDAGNTTPPLISFGEFQNNDADEKEYVQGSSHVALQIPHPFTKYYFIELAPDRIENLNAIKREYAGRRNIEVIQDDAANALERILRAPDINWKKSRGVVFLDPFGMQVPWQVIEDIAANKHLEIILNLPVGMAIQRFLPKSGQFSDEQRKYLNEYFGSTEWEQIIYQKSPDLFGGEYTTKFQDSGERLALWYSKRLKKAFGFCPPPRLITNTRGTHLYYLLFAGPKENGAKIAEHVLNQGASINKKRL